MRSDITCECGCEAVDSLPCSAAKEFRKCWSHHMPSKYLAKVQADCVVGAPTYGLRDGEADWVLRGQYVAESRRAQPLGVADNPTMGTGGVKGGIGTMAQLSCYQRAALRGCRS